MQEKIYKQDFFSDEVPTISHALAGFNKFYKEINDIYHEIALNAGLSDSSFDILYSIFAVFKVIYEKYHFYQNRQ